jgi:hypothetical protein
MEAVEALAVEGGDGAVLAWHHSAVRLLGGA